MAALIPITEVQADQSYWFNRKRRDGSTVWIPGTAVSINGALMVINASFCSSIDVEDESWLGAKAMSQYTFLRFLSKTYGILGNQQKSMDLYWKAMSGLTPEQHRTIVEVRKLQAGPRRLVASATAP